MFIPKVNYLGADGRQNAANGNASYSNIHQSSQKAYDGIPVTH